MKMAWRKQWRQAIIDNNDATISNAPNGVTLSYGVASEKRRRRLAAMGMKMTPAHDDNANGRRDVCERGGG